MAYKLGQMDVPLDILTVEFGLESLVSRRLCNDIIGLVHKLINGILSCPEFLMKINFKIPTLNSRNNRPFLVPRCSTNLIKHIPEYHLLDRYL